MPNPFKEELARRGANPFEAELSQREGFGPGLMSAATYGARGANVGFADVLGAPVDATSWLMGKIRGQEMPTPIGGSESIRGAMDVLASPFTETATYEGIEEVPEEMRPYARGGEAIGASIPIAAAPAAAALRAGTQKATGMFAPIVEAARQAPGAFAAAELSAAGGAGVGGGVAEAAFPDQVGPRITGEIAGGLANPGTWIARGLQRIPTAVDRVRQMTSRSGQELSASRSLRGAMERAGEAPEGVVREAEAPTAIPGLRYPTAAKTGSPTVAALQENIIRKMPEVGNDVRQRMSEATETLNRAYRTAIESGDPQAIREAAQARQDWFSDMLDARVGSAEARLQEAVEGLRPGQTAADASEEAKGALVESLQNARKAEREIWSKVPKDVQITPTGTSRAYADLRAEMLPEQRMPSPEGFNLEAFLTRAQAESMRSGELQQARSLTLGAADAERAAGNFNSARQLDNLADGMLEDIAGLSEEARSFSRALNETYRRPNVERILARTRQGAERVAPEETLQRVVGRGGVGGDVAGRELEAAAQFGGRTTLPQQEQFLRGMASRTLNPDGTVNANKLAAFQRDNAQLIERLGADVGTTEAAQRALDDVADASQVTRQAVDKAAFSRLAGFEDPVQGVKAVLSGNTPLQDYRQLATTARQAGPEAVSGLRGATFDFLFDATQNQGLTSGKLMREILNRRTGNQPSLVETMTDAGVLNETQRKNLFKVINETERLERLLDSGRQIDEILENATGLEDLLTRVIGANVGGMGAVGQITGTPIVAAQAGSRFARQIAQDIPLGKTREILGQAISDPEFMARLLKRTRNPREKEAMRRQINAYLLQTAFEREE